ncbi:hypothetical protein ATZ35_06310 [Enterococcus rotai]|uniref:Uncharacterized protein n=1 Tax=Enterococcus rotai TaxID=118060 RepID=A0A0U2XHE4_9ENTE|nr:hypothetical protein ATZ35_06310 [Enterococcus rotai]
MALYFGWDCYPFATHFSDYVIKRHVFNEKIKKKENELYFKFQFTFHDINMLRLDCVSIYLIKRTDRTLAIRTMNNL